MRYMRKINYVDAVRWTGENKDEVEKFANGEIEATVFDRDSIVLTTPNGQVIAEKGDWICKDSIGKLYPCNSAVFRMTYYEIPIEYEEDDYERVKPCPFCGDIVEIREEMDGRAETYSIHCRGCDMHYTKFVWRARDKRGVVKEWNQRANQ